MRLGIETSGCIKCGSCISACPVIAAEGVQRFSGPRNLAVEAPRFLPDIAATRDNIMMCTTCWKCEEVCLANLPLPEAMLRIRKLIFSDKEMLEGHRRIAENIDNYRRSIEPHSGLKVPPPKETGEVMYFPGCISRERITSIYESSMSVLGKVGADFGVPNGWVCCGAPLEKIGDSERLRILREENLSRFEGFREIVTSCPGCTSHLLKHYDLEPLHTIEFLYENLGLSRLRFKSSASTTRVALHHPCHLARTVGPHVIDYAYAVLQSVPGLRLVEMEDPGSCCGGGGGVVAGYPNIALDLATEKTRKAKEAGAELLLAPCPFCVLNLRRVDLLEIGEFISFLNERLE
ncbi:MAG: heterodisulfide reductase-related iron-sulfur binding cluster [Methanomassiliicoccales archaeon]